MQIDNTTHLNTEEYDEKINDTLPYYSEFYKQTVDIIKQLGLAKIDWLDLGCGTGTLEEIALKKFDNTSFVLVDPSSNMLEHAKRKLKRKAIEYICCGSDKIHFENRFNVVTAIQAHHYMKEAERIKATENVYRALRKGGIYINFENIIPADVVVKNMELKRWGDYQIRHGKTMDEVKGHIDRCGFKYFPITVEKHKNLLKKMGFEHVHVFWYSYMQMGIYAIK